MTLSLPLISSLFSLPSDCARESLLGITAGMSIVHVHVGHTNSLALHSHDTLPLPFLPVMIIPVDPMGWSSSLSEREQAVLLSVSEHGDLAFWACEMGSKPDWRCTGRVSTGRSSLKLAACSSAKKSALGKLSFAVPYAAHPLVYIPVVPVTEGEELTIWDSKESEFASGLEFGKVYR